MKVKLHDPSDLLRLRQWVRDEANAKQRDRIRSVLIAAEGIDGMELRRDQIAWAVGRSRQFVDEWVKRYRTGGLDALRPKKQTGRPSLLTVQEKEQLKEALDAGPQEGVDPRAVFFGQDVRELIRRRFNKLYSPSGVYKLLETLGYSWLCPRPHHPKGDPAAQDAFKKSGRTDRDDPDRTPRQACFDVLPG
jgi:putative transposase